MAKRSARNLKRRLAQREPKRLFHILCEGEKTEPGYFTALKQIVRGALIEIRPRPAVGVPMTIAAEAKALAREFGLARRSKKPSNSFEEKDEVWAVFDRDEHPSYEQATNECRSANVGVAKSNPCFELWLTLHCQDFDRPMSRHEMQRHLETLDEDYCRSKGKSGDFAAMLGNLAEAEARAAVLLERRADEGAPGSNPSTTVHLLTTRIIAAAKAFK